MSDKNGSNRSPIAEAIHALQNALGVWFVAIVVFVILIGSLVGGYGFHVFMTRQSYHELAQNYENLGKINARQIGNLKELLKLNEELVKRTEVLKRRKEILERKIKLKEQNLELIDQKLNR